MRATVIGLVRVGLQVRLVAILLLAMAALAGPSVAFDGYLGRKRPLLVFSPSESQPNFVRQKNAINGHRIGMSDRDMVVLYVVGNGVKADFGAQPRLGAGAIRSRYRVPEGQFRVLLLGKDGGLKRDASTFVPITEIFAEIDRMPMRREEVRRRSDRP
jgi:hypothetical protein